MFEAVMIKKIHYCFFHFWVEKSTENHKKNDYFIHPKLKISTQMRGNDEKVVEIEIERLHDFKNHPFKVQADSQMKELQDSISKYGILNPLIVRPRPEGFYEVISGHRRKYAAMELKYTKVLVIK